jgi:GTP cyclohydrolase II
MDIMQKANVVRVRMPTAHGDFTLWAFKFNEGAEATLALVKGDLAEGEAVPVRIHSSCITGDIFHSERCDCGPQLNFAMRFIQEAGKGAIVYLHQEGRGIGLFSKLQAYELQEKGLDTVEANLALGLPVDCREYSNAISAIKELGIKSIRLMSNNPTKAACLESAGIEVVDRIPVEVGINENNVQYLVTKRDRMGHKLTTAMTVRA